MFQNKPDDAVAQPQDTETLRNELGILRSKVADLSSLIEVSIIINSTVDPDRLISLVIEKAQAVMKAEASSVMLVNHEKNILECKVALGEVGEQVMSTMHLKMGEGIAGWVAKHGQPQIVPDVLKDPRFTSKIDHSTGFQTRSILAAPLIVKEKVIGVAEVINRLDGAAFDTDDLELFCTFCRQVALAIDNVRMVHIEIEKQKLEQQLDAAKFIQQSFMPAEFPNSSDRNYAVAAKSIPAKSIGGDFYDLIEFDSGTVGFAVGDVTGKGIPAALYMARLVSDFRIYCQMHEYPAQVLKSLNNVLVERSRRGMFVTFQYGLLDPSTGEFRYANAGHLPFIRISQEKNKVEFIKDAKTVPLGILPDLNLEEKKLQLDEGDSIVLITDGIVEAKSQSGARYSFEKVVKQFSKPCQSVEELVSGMIAEVRDFSDGSEQYDDLTIMALKWQ
ncbi:MAG: SpoIIE family protein phosphatase [bacterium]